MKKVYFAGKYLILLCSFLLVTITCFAQRNYATTNQTGASGVLCLNCIVTNANNASDGNLQTFSVLNVTVGVLSQTYEELIFPGAAKVAANTLVTIKLGSGNNLLDLTALGGIQLQAYNGNTPIGSGISAATLLTAVSNNNQVEVSFKPTQIYDRVRVTLNGGLVGALSSIYLYEAFYNGTGPVACNTAIDEIHGISAGLLNLGVDVGGVANPQRAIDGNIATASTLNAGVGVVGAYAQQTIIFQTLSTVGDSVRVTLSVPNALIAASVLSNISVSTYNGNTSNNDSRAFNSGLLNLQLLDLTNNVQRFTITYTPSKTFDRVQVTLGSGIANVLSSLNLYEAQLVIPRPVITYNNATISNVQLCSGGSAVLTATAMPNTTFNWYTAATGGAPIATGATFTTPALTATTIYYVAASRTGCTDESARTPVTITINPVPAAPVLTNANVNSCDGDMVVLSVASPVAGVTYNWYSAATGGTLLFTGTNFTTPALHATTSYYVEADNAAGCNNTTRTQATVTIQPKPADATLSATSLNITAGQTTTITVSNAQAGNTYNWYTSATAATPFFTGTSYTTPSLFTNTTYYVGGVNSTGCQSVNRTAITINVQADNPVCTIGNIQTSTVSGTCIGCGVSNNNFAADADTTTSSTIAVGAGLAGAYVEQQVQFQQAGFAGDTVKVVLQTPVSLANVSLLGQISVTLYNGATPITTYTLDNAAIKLRVGGGTNRYAVLVPATGPYDRVAIRLNSGAATLLTSLQVFYAAQLYGKPVFANPNPAICKGSPAALAITSPANGGTFNWYTVPTGGTAVFTGVNVTTGPLTTNTTYYVDYSRGTCVGTVRYPINILVNDPPVKPLVVPTSATITSGQTATFKATPVNNSTINWYTTPTGGAPIFTGATFTTPSLTANTSYYAEAANGTCVSPDRTEVDVTVTPIVIPDVTVSPLTQTIIAGTSGSLTASSTTPGAVFNWYTIPTGGTSIFTGATFFTPPLLNNTTYYADATIPGTGAVSATRASGVVNVTLIVAPDVTVTPPTQTVASGSTAILTASSLIPGTIFNWYTSPTGGASIFTGPTFTTPPVITGVIYYADATIVATGTVSATRASGAVNVAAVVNPDITVTPPTQTVAVGSSAMLTASSTTPGATFNWYTTPTGGTPIFTGSVFNTPPVLTGTTYYAEAEVPATGAVSTTRATGVVNVSAVIAPDVTVTPATQTVASGATATLTAASSTPGAVFNWYTTPTGGTSIFTGATFVTPPITAGVTYYADATIPATNTVSAGRASGTVNVAGTATVFPDVTVTPATQTVVIGTQATLVASSTSPGTVFEWYTTPTGGAPIFTGATFNTPPVTANTTYYAQAIIAATGVASVTRASGVINTTAAVIPDVTVTPPTQTVASGTIVTLTASSTIPGTIFNWYTTPTGGSSIFTGPTFTTPPITTATAYYADATIAITNTVSANRASGIINITGTATAYPDVTVTPPTQTVIAGSSATLTASSTTSGTAFNWYTTPTGGALIFTGAVFNTPPVTTNTTYYAEAVVTATGVASTTRASGVVNVIPIVVPNVAVTPPTQTVTAGTTATMMASSTTPGTIFKWYTTPTGGTSIFTGATFSTPPLTTNTTYYAEAVVTATNTPSATRASGVVAVAPAPTAPQVAAAGTTPCFGTSTMLTVSNPDPAFTVKWYSDAAATLLVNTGNTFTTPVLTASVTYYLQSSNLAGAKSAITSIAVQVSAQLIAPVVTVSASTASSVTFQWTAITGATGYQYSLDNGATFNTNGSGTTYMVSNLQSNQSVNIIIRATSACGIGPNSLSLSGIANNPLDNGIYVPNAFTPNGDGKNDIFYVYGTNIKSLNLWVYDQWGELQFKSPLQSSGWDGTYKGRAQPTGVYVYYVEAIMNNGSKQTKKGTITLLR